MRDKLYNDMIIARKDKNKELLSALTMAWSEITATEKTEKLEKLADTRFIAVMNKLIKQDKETLEGFQKRGDKESIASLENRLAIYQSYLPKQLTDEELAGIVREVIANMAPDKVNMGTVMKAVTPKVAGNAEMSRVSACVKGILSKG
ncbi:MAG: GatB/YqeY domain-containing protein [Syntrophomonadaceae bacterium]